MPMTVTYTPRAERLVQSWVSIAWRSVVAMGALAWLGGVREGAEMQAVLWCACMLIPPAYAIVRGEVRP